MLAIYETNVVQIILDTMLTCRYMYILSIEWIALIRRISVKTRMVWLIAAFVMALPLSPYNAQAAGFLDDLMGYNQGQTQTYQYTVTNSGQPQYNQPAPSGGAYTAAPTRPVQPSAVVQQPVAPRVAYQQTIPQAQTSRQLRPASAAAPRQGVVRSSGTANNNRSLKAQPAKPRQQQVAVRPSPSNYAAQPRPVIQQRHYQPSQTGYFANPYQSQYSATPNYYQGHYNTWGSSTQACAPGRA